MADSALKSTVKGSAVRAARELLEVAWQPTESSTSALCSLLNPGSSCMQPTVGARATCKSEHHGHCYSAGVPKLSSKDQI